MSDFEYEEKPFDNLLEYRAPGPVGRRCLNSNEFIRFIMGPVGSGKTTLCLFDAIKKALEMPKAVDGDRYFSGVVIRETYTQLWSTTIRSWNKFFPQSMGDWTGGQGRPAYHNLKIEVADGSHVHLQMRFTALADQSVEDALRGAEYTWAYMNEGDRLVEDVLTYLISRVGRYPDNFLMGGQDFWHGIIGDINPPDTDSWIYRRFVENKQDGDLHEFHRQPGGRDPRAENIVNLPKRYYDKQIAANRDKPWWIRRMVDAEFGYSRDGLPVYSTFDDQLHVAEHELEAAPDIPLLLAFDQGITQPAMAVLQPMSTGQLRMLDEYVPGRMGATTFGQNCRALLNERFPGIPLRNSGVADLAGWQGEIREDGHLSWASMVEQALGLPLIPSETNEFDPRFEALNQLLTFMPAPGIPGFLLSKRCKMMRKAMNSHYRFKKIQGVEEQYNPRPEKNIYANIVEAAQYGALHFYGLAGVIGGGARAGAKPRDSEIYSPDRGGERPPAPGSFDVFNIG